ncbi:hypothetical protein [Saccharothrix sp. HUAS TT1]|uniref:hypothetical protein n=1 Tax=unclassified Saccharothrix TaxID=2593673 RepID=UPI00345BD144
MPPPLAGDGPIVGDPALLRRAGEHFGVQAGIFRSILSDYDYLHKPPVKTSVPDAMETSTGKTFLPPYMEITHAFMTAVRGISRGLTLTQDKLDKLAQSQEDAEETNTRYAQNAVVVPPGQGPGAPLRKGTTPRDVDQPSAITPARTGPIRKGVVPRGEALDQRVPSDIGIPVSPQVLVNALGERIGVLAPMGAEVPGEDGRVFLTGPDGRLKGFFQPDDEHTLDEVVRGVLQPGFVPSREEEPVEPLSSTPSLSFPAERVDGPNSLFEPPATEPLRADSIAFPGEPGARPVDDLGEPLPVEVLPDGTELYAPVWATPAESLQTPPVVVVPEERDPNES